MQGSRHRPLLSLDSKLFRAEGGARCPNASYSQLDERHDERYEGRPSSALTTRIDQATTRGVERLDKFVKVEGSTTRSNRPKDIAVNPPVERLASAPLQTQVIDSGPLLKHSLTGGATATLTLDRHLQYRADSTAAVAWNYRNCTPSSLANPFSPNPALQNPFDDADNNTVAVPRSLMCFCLELEPFNDESGFWPKENFEFVSIQLDFKKASSIRPVRHQRNISSPSTSHFRPDNPRTHSVSGLPIVRGFTPLDLVSTNFLQDFGPTLYQGLNRSDTPEEPIIVGSGKQNSMYRDFERKLARIAKPTVIEGDKLTARGCQAMASACPTPASSTFTQANTPFNSPHIESAEYGTSSIRIMVKRDPECASSWSKRRFPFVILLEHPPDVPSIEARIRLDTTTIRKATATTPSRRPIRMLSFERPRKASWRSGADSDGLDPGYESSTSRGTSFSQPSRMQSSHGRSMSETSVRSSSGRNVEDFEQIVKIYPRRDPVSVISCGLGTVKDTLFQSGMAPKPQFSGPPKSAQDRPVPKRTPSGKTPVTPRFDKPLPTPRAEEIEQAPPPLPPRPPAKPTHQYSRSAYATPSVHCPSPPPLHKRQYGSYSSSAGSSSLNISHDSGDSLPRSLPSERPPASPYPLRNLASRQASVSSSWTAFAAPSPIEQVLGTSASRPRLDRIPVTQQEEADGELFDMVLTNWQDRKMDREQHYALPEPGITYVHSPTFNRNTFIP